VPGSVVGGTVNEESGLAVGGVEEADALGTAVAGKVGELLGGGTGDGVDDGVTEDDGSVVGCSLGVGLAEAKGPIPR
jgi:hypothetical protein